MMRVRMLLAGALLFACTAPAPVPSAPQTRTVAGVLTLVYGDPQPPATAGTVVASLTEAGGRTYNLQADSATSPRIGELRRFDRAWVRVVGQLRGGDTLTLWLTRIDSLPRAP